MLTWALTLCSCKQLNIDFKTSTSLQLWEFHVNLVHLYSGLALKHCINYGCSKYLAIKGLCLDTYSIKLHLPGQSQI